jgi:hypothetical protein
MYTGGTKEMKCLYRGLKPRLKSTFASLMIFALLFSFLGAISPATAAAATPADSLIVNIDNNGETTTVHTYTLAEMEALSGEDIVYYSSIDSMPAPVLTIARGVTLSSLVQDLNEKHNANITLSPDTLKSIKLHATDGWSATYSYDYLFGAPRNYYPQLVSCWDENSGLTGPGSDADPVALEPMFAVSSFQGRFLTDLDPGKMIGPGEEGSTTFRFCFGQTAVELANTMPTTGRFGKYIWKMDIVMDIAPPESLPAPELTADSTDNTVGQAIDITFTDDEAWREAITGITVDGNALTSEQYTVSAGKINIATGVFTAAGDYEIVVQADGYENAIVNQIIISTASPGAWDGSIDTSWYNTEDTNFEISSPAELAGLADIVNGTTDGIAQDDFQGKTVTLTSDIDLGGIQNEDGTWDPASIQWTAIGGGEARCAFNGTFDGGGHIVSNLYIERQDAGWQTYGGRNQGLFGITDPAAIVKNLGVTGYVAANRSVGGVVGKNNGRVESCFNAATVIGTDSKGVGGITGANWNNPSIINCYNIGSVLTKYGTGLAGGIAGDNEYLVSNCYNAGQITSTHTGANVGGIVGNIKYGFSPPIVQDCYYNSELNDKGIGYIDTSTYTVTNVEGKTAEEMKTAEFVALLNGENGSAFVQDTNNINNGFPILTWQAPAQPVYTITPEKDESYSIGKTDDGFNFMTVNPGFSGMKYFGVGVTPVIGHEGMETVVFVHLEDGVDGIQRSINATRADFDLVPFAKAGFNVDPGDVVKVFIVDALTNAADNNPFVLQ